MDMNLWHWMVMIGWGGNKNGAGLKGSQTEAHRAYAPSPLNPSSISWNRGSCPLGMSFECKMLYWLTW